MAVHPIVIAINLIIFLIFYFGGDIVAGFVWGGIQVFLIFGASFGSENYQKHVLRFKNNTLTKPIVISVVHHQNSTAEEIVKLAELHKSGALTAEEFAQAKAKILKSA